MRTFTRLAYLLVGLSVAACGPGEFGASCEQDGSCASGHCRQGICTKACAGQGECPQGYDCGAAVAGEATCYKITYDATSEGGFGTGCALSVGDCTKQPNPCASGFVCHGHFTRLTTDRACVSDADCQPGGSCVTRTGGTKTCTLWTELQCDADAMCTKTCTADTDCPPTMYCAVERDGSKMCLRRTYCSECVTDDQCPQYHVCVGDTTGGHYCARPCHGAANSPDCYQPAPGGQPFQMCAADGGGEGQICQPSGGACHGESTVAGIGVNNVCSPCRFGMPSDCENVKDATGASVGFCVNMEYTHEAFCSVRCQVTLAPASGGFRVTRDTCQDISPNLYCYFGGKYPASCGTGCTLNSYCHADGSYKLETPTCYPTAGL